MVARVIYLIVLNAAFLVAFVWYLPISSVLDARGYAPEKITAVEKVLTQGADEPVPEEPQEARRTTDSATPHAGDSTQTTPDSASDDTQPPEPESAGPSEAARSEEPEAAPAESPQVLVATDVINVRAGQGTDTEVIDQLQSGTTVEVLADPEGDWIEIGYGTGTGWVYRPLFKPADE